MILLLFAYIKNESDEKGGFQMDEKIALSFKQSMKNAILQRHRSDYILHSLRCPIELRNWKRISK